MTEAATETTPARSGTVYTTVTMDDGRVVDFAGKRKMVKEVVTGKDGHDQIRLNFLNGEVRLMPIPESLTHKCALHGLGQKLGDEIAGVEDIDDCVLAIDSLMDRLNAGEWVVRREAGSALAGTSVLCKALMEMSGKTVEQIRNFLSDKTQAQKNALRGNSGLIPIIARLEANKKTKVKDVIDTAALLEEIA